MPEARRLAALLALSLAPGFAAAQPGDMDKRVAACVACHGRVSAAANAEFVPRLAGKPAGYLYNQLQSFRDGRRAQRDMTHLVRHMSDDYLREIAGHFAAMDFPYPPSPARTDATADTLRRGEQLARRGDPQRGIPSCAACHGDSLAGVQPGTPPLLGLPRLYIASQFGAWATDARHALAPDCMADVARKLADPDIQAVASWLAIQPVPPRMKAEPPKPFPVACSAAVAPGAAR